MRNFSSTRDQKPSPSTPVQERGATIAPITLSENSLLVLALARIFVGFLWFQQLFWKLPPSFAGLRKYVESEAQHTFLPGYPSLIKNVLLPNFILLGAGTWTAELLVALCLMFGFFSRFGALLSLLMAIQLYIGLAYAPGEWYWTYGMLVLLGVVLAALPSGRRLGVDQWLFPRLAKAGRTSRIARLLSWFA
ncbi:MAG: hypothetical protein JOZ18_20410 [Chloroflexi bacterium]|nr:hypothetical protein [Chloroflexota bacterium]